MIKYSRVYRNQSTVIPKEADSKILNKEDTIQWTINQKTEEITIKFLSENNYNNKTIKTEEFIYVYRNISKKRQIIVPVEIKKMLNFDYRKHLLKWIITDEKISIDKHVKTNFMNISGILKRRGDEKHE